MNDIHDEVRDAVREGFKEVLTDSTFLEHFIDPRIGKIVIEKMTEKIDKTFGVDCMDHDERQKTTRVVQWGVKMMEWAESEDGVTAIATFKKLMKIIDFAASSAVKIIIYLIVAGAGTLVVVGAATHKGIKAWWGA